MKKFFLVALTVLICTLSLVGCSKKETTNASTTTATTTTKTETVKASVKTTLDKPVSIEFWHSYSGTQLPVINGLVDEFNATIGKEKGITVTAVAQGSGPQTYQKVVGAIKAGNAPAVAVSKPIYVQDYIMADAVVDLKPYVTDSTVGIKDYDDFYKVFRDEAEAYSEPGMYDLPISKNADVLYYNVDFFNEHGLTPPETWDDLQVLGEKIYAITGKGAFGYDNVQYLFENLTKQYGGDYTNNKGELLFGNSSAALDALTMYANNVWSGVWRTVGEDAFFSGPFARQTIQMYVGGTVESQYINMKDPQFKWSAVPLPQKDLNNKKTLSYDNVICALKTNKSQDEIYAAYEFIKFITSTEANAKITVGMSFMPVRESVLTHPDYVSYVESGENDALIAASAQKDYLYYQPVFIGEGYTSSTVDDEITSMMKRVLDNHEDPASAIEGVINQFK